MVTWLWFLFSSSARSLGFSVISITCPNCSYLSHSDLVKNSSPCFSLRLSIPPTFPHFRSFLRLSLCFPLRFPDFQNNFSTLSPISNIVSLSFYNDDARSHTTLSAAAQLTRVKACLAHTSLCWLEFGPSRLRLALLGSER